MSTPLPSDEDFEALRRQLLATARASSLPHADAEDVTQDALLKLIKDRRPSPLPLRSRARRKLRDATAEHFRNPKRTLLATAVPLAEQDELARDEVALEMIGLRDLVKSIGGPDVLAYARLKALKVPDREVAQRLGWNPQRVEAARKKFSRNSAKIIDVIKESTS